MGQTVSQSAADLHNADGAFCLGDIKFSLLWSVVRKHFFQLPGGDKENIVGQNLLYVVIVNGHVFLRFAQHLIDCADGGFQGFQIAFFLGNDLFPIPLIHIDGMNIVRLFISADGAHIGVKSFAHGKSVFFQGIPFPLCQGLHDLGFPLLLIFDIEGYRTLHTV